jgi:hypothetical protein
MTASEGAAFGLPPDLTTAERRRRNKLMTDVADNTQAGIQANIAVGRALRELRDKRLYRETHSTFELFVKEHWGLSRPRAYEFIKAADTADALSASGRQAPQPSSERVARELKGTAAQKRKTWEETTKKHGPKPTAAQTREVRQSHQSKAAQAPKGDLGSDPLVIDWVRRERETGKSRDEILALAKAEANGWPRPGVNLSKGVLSGIWRLIDAGKMPKTTPESVRRARQREAKTRMEKISAELQVQSKVASELQEINRLSLSLSSIIYQLDYDALDALDNKWLNRMMEGTFDNLVDLDETIQLRIGEIMSRADDKAIRAKIATMRNPAGREGPEYETALRLADMLERKHFGPRSIKPPSEAGA